VPVCAVLVWLLLVKGDYKSVEKVFLAASVFYIAYIITGVLSGPSWREAMLATVKAPPTSVWHTPGYISMTIAVIGTTISPWMQFYLQSSVVEKGVSVKDYGASRLDVIIGSIFTDVVGWFIVVACAATLYAHGVGSLTVPADAAEAMKPLAKEYAYLLFAVGLFNASFFAASVLPLSTAYTVCEGLGFESGVDKSFREAPVFYWLYTLLIVLGAGVLLVPRLPLVYVAVLSQVANGVVLPLVLIFMLMLTNDRELMGEHVNSRAFNIVAWTTVIVMIVLTVLMVLTQR
jgi:Mn2+/Fe2+ NRAMP family transporter